MKKSDIFWQTYLNLEKEANAAGAIIGSKFVQLLEQANGDADKALDNLFDALAK